MSAVERSILKEPAKENGESNYYLNLDLSHKLF